MGAVDKAGLGGLPASFLSLWEGGEGWLEGR